MLFDHAVTSGVTALVVDQQSVADFLYGHPWPDGVAFPGGVSIAVLGDTIGARPGTGSAPEWSGFRTPRKLMGAAATRALVDRLDADAGADGPTAIRVPCEIVEGETIFAPPAP